MGCDSKILPPEPNTSNLQRENPRTDMTCQGSRSALPSSSSFQSEGQEPEKLHQKQSLPDPFGGHLRRPGLWTEAVIDHGGQDTFQKEATKEGRVWKF